jgi:site-specific DNA-methyltransferase (adenine-specific)
MLLNIIHNCNSIVGMKDEIEDNCVDLIVTDPPFAIKFTGKKANYNRTEENVLDGYEEIDEANYQEFTYDWLSQSKRILKPSGAMYIFSGWNHLRIILDALHELGFEIINHIIWKYNFGVNCTNKYISSHYHILYVCFDKRKVKFLTYSRFSKGEKIPFTKKDARYADMEDVWTISRENWTGKIKTATKLPGEIIKKILSYSAEPGDLIVDPFSGSGQVAWFTRKMGANYICFEKSKEIYDFSMRRLNENLYTIPIKKNDIVYSTTGGLVS